MYFLKTINSIFRFNLISVGELRLKMSEQSGLRDIEKRATFGMGCFWSGDSIFGATPGILRTTVGYAGGTTRSPTYKNM